jgi:hypothetical protein
MIPGLSERRSRLRDALKTTRVLNYQRGFNAGWIFGVLLMGCFRIADWSPWKVAVAVIAVAGLSVGVWGHYKTAGEDDRS